ncbi:DNA repair protein RadC [Leptolyngbya sp. PL-A3]|uniref:RadC family protein n=1 Tax=Leptolyngbya sp. PL-A3 TaxID=2933911 RepID=UPI0032978615
MPHSFRTLEGTTEEASDLTAVYLPSSPSHAIRSESPLERLQVRGPSVLTTEELLALLLGTGNSSWSSPLVQRVIEAVQHGDGNLRQRLLRVDMAELMAIHGVGTAKAARVIAAIELGRRLYLHAPPLGTVIDTPDLAVAVISPHLMCKPFEGFVVVCLDIKHRFVSSKLLSMGTDTETLAHPRIIFGEALRRGATRIIVGHNHPSGEVDPSPDDIALTRQILNAGVLLDMPVLDHLILGCGTYKSLRQCTTLWEEVPQGTKGEAETTVHERIPIRSNVAPDNTYLHLAYAEQRCSEESE